MLLNRRFLNSLVIKEPPRPSYKIEVIETSTPANGVGYVAGESITLMTRLTNTGNVLINNIGFRIDSRNSLSQFILDIGDSVTSNFTNYSHTVTQEDCDEGRFILTPTITNYGTYTDNGTTINIDSDCAEIVPLIVSCLPYLTVTASDIEYKLGDTVTFTIQITNPFDESKIIEINSVEGLDLSNDSIEANPNETVVTTATYTIDEANIQDGEFTATFEAYIDSETYSAECTVYTEAPNPSLYITQTFEPPSNGEYYTEYDDEYIGATVRVKNDGNVTLTDIKFIFLSNGDDYSGAEQWVNTLAPDSIETVGLFSYIGMYDYHIMPIDNILTTQATVVRPLGESLTFTSEEYECEIRTSLEHIIDINITGYYSSPRDFRFVIDSLNITNNSNTYTLSDFYDGIEVLSPVITYNSSYNSSTFTMEMHCELEQDGSWHDITAYVPSGASSGTYQSYYAMDLLRGFNLSDFNNGVSTVTIDDFGFTSTDDAQAANLGSLVIKIYKLSSTTLQVGITWNKPLVNS